jgi:hypothetical protein
LSIRGIFLKKSVISPGKKEIFPGRKDYFRGRNEIFPGKNNLFPTKEERKKHRNTLINKADSDKIIIYFMGEVI